jgi:hypothetical protein
MVLSVHRIYDQSKVISKLSCASKRTNDKNLAIFGHFQKVGASKKTKRGVKSVLRRKNCSEKKNNTHNNVAKFDFSFFFSKCDEMDKTGRYN